MWTAGWSFTLNEDWTANGHHGAFTAGSLVASTRRPAKPQLIVQPGPTQTIDDGRG